MGMAPLERAASAFFAASSARRWISSGLGRDARTSGGMSCARLASFVRHFWRSASALSESRSFEKRERARSLRSRRRE